jgi:hypothetical protein
MSQPNSVRKYQGIISRAFLGCSAAEIVTIASKSAEIAKRDSQFGHDICTHHIKADINSSYQQAWTQYLKKMKEWNTQVQSEHVVLNELNARWKKCLFADPSYDALRKQTPLEVRYWIRDLICDPHGQNPLDLCDHPDLDLISMLWTIQCEWATAFSLCQRYYTINWCPSLS